LVPTALSAWQVKLEYAVSSPSTTRASRRSPLPRSVVPAQRFSPAAEEAMHKFAWVPFGAGPRMCMGANFAMLSTTLAFATLMSKHRFTAVKDRGAVFPIEYDITMHFPGNVEMEISRR